MQRCGPFGAFLSTMSARGRPLNMCLRSTALFPTWIRLQAYGYGLRVWTNVSARRAYHVNYPHRPVATGARMPSSRLVTRTVGPPLCLPRRRHQRHRGRGAAVPRSTVTRGVAGTLFPSLPPSSRAVDQTRGVKYGQPRRCFNRREANSHHTRESMYITIFLHYDNTSGAMLPC